MYNKVFGIGLNRTGTTSLSMALEILGLRSRHYCSCTCNYPSTSIEDIPSLDAVVDSELKYSYDMLDLMFPNSRFILTVRDKDDWKESASKFGVEDDYEDHLQKVIKYFELAGKDRLLMIDICAGEGWEKLCGFLGKSVPSQIFPNVSRSSSHA